MTNRQSDFITQYRQVVTQAIKAIADLRSLTQEAEAMNYPSQLNPDLAFAGANGDIDADKMASAMLAVDGILSAITLPVSAAIYSIRV